MLEFHLREDVHTLIQALTVDFRAQYDYLTRHREPSEYAHDIAIQNDAVDSVARALAPRLTTYQGGAIHSRQNELRRLQKELVWLFGNPRAEEPCVRLRDCGLFHKINESCTNGCEKIAVPGIDYPL